MPGLLDDPMAAGFIPLIAATLFAWVMYYQLANDRGAYNWWGRLLTSLRLLPKEDPDMGVVVDRREVMENSTTFFKWVGIIAVVWLILHGFFFYRRLNPYFLWGPKPTQLSDPAARTALPPRTVGAGGGGATNAGSPAMAPGGPSSPVPADAGGAPPPGGAPGTLPPPGAPGSAPVGVPAGGMMSAPGPGGMPGGPGGMPGGPAGMPGGPGSGAAPPVGR